MMAGHDTSGILTPMLKDSQTIVQHLVAMFMLVGQDDSDDTAHDKDWPARQMRVLNIRQTVK
jgi:hypothetical protein